MKDSVKIPLARMVTMNPAAAPILEKYNLDFCCKGKQSLMDAMSDRQEEFAEVTTELEKVFNTKDNSGVDFNSYSLTELSDHIINVHHKYVREISPVILGHLEKVAGKHGDRYPEMKEILELFRQLKNELDQH